MAIILLTLVTKIVFLPLTFKSSESMAKMAALNPKMQEIRTRLKDKPEKMNQEIAELYKKEKVNPLSGCLPLLLQIPIFFALYNLLNTQFELRGAMFIPGWIPDLSVPESVYYAAHVPSSGHSTDIRLLPLIMLGTQLLSSKITQPPSADASGAQMKLLNYAMPVVFLFMLYDMPSGLTLYWTVQNVLSIVQQVYINWTRKRKAAVAGARRVTGRRRHRRDADDREGVRGQQREGSHRPGHRGAGPRQERDRFRDRGVEEPGHPFRGGKVKIRVHVSEEEVEAAVQDGRLSSERPPEARTPRRGGRREARRRTRPAARR